MACQKSEGLVEAKKLNTHVNLHNPNLMENAGAKKNRLKTASLYEPVSTLFFFFCSPSENTAKIC